MLFTSDHPHPPQRPLPPSRTTSYSKRHASFDSPREVPLPSPSSQLSSYFPLFSATASHARTSSRSSQGQGADSNSTVTTDDYPVFDQNFQDGSESGDDSLPSAPSSPNSSPSSGAQLSPPNGTDMAHKRMTGVEHTGGLLPESNGQGTPNPRDRSSSPEAARPRPQLMQSHSGSSQSNTSVGPVFPWSRPYSLPQNHSNTLLQGSAMPTPTQTKPHWPDRSSSASLPLPMQTPYFTLPATSDLTTAAPLNEDAEMQDTEAESSRTRPPPAPSQPSSSNVRQSYSPFAPRYPTPAPASSVTAMPSRAQPSNSSPAQRSISAASANYYPAPAAPVILTPPPPPTGSSSRPHAPYEPFLCHNPVSEDRHSISVETLNREYRLLVRLPGFSRDAM